MITAVYFARFLTMSKRSHPESTSSSSATATAGGGDSGVSAPKRPFLSGSEMVLFRSVRSLEELDKRTLQLQNKKLSEALSERRSAITDLRQRIEQLENRQAKDDALLCVVNRYWNQVCLKIYSVLELCASCFPPNIRTSMKFKSYTDNGEV